MPNRSKSSDEQQSDDELGAEQQAEKPEPQPEETPTGGDYSIVEERMDRLYPNRHMTAEERPPVPESGIEESPEVEPEPHAEGS